MEKNELKKIFYKENPTATLQYIKNGSALYEVKHNNLRVIFVVPVSDMGDAEFGLTMDSKLLNRWITEIIEL